MRLLADENVPGDLVRALRTAAHDVAWVRELAPGIDDVAVLACAQREARVLLTFDKGFRLNAESCSSGLQASVPAS